MNRALVRLRDRNQITLPAEVVSGLGIEVGDWLELTVSNSNCVQLRPARIVTADTPEARQLEHSAAENVRQKKYSTFRSSEEFDRHLDKIANADVIELPSENRTVEPVKMVSSEEIKQRVMSAVEAALRDQPATYFKQE
jgi:bifunctional DNA-binding transcriptional regulator/antitoxin component of YhaV-PrlF toxin-antitoxin module